MTMTLKTRILVTFLSITLGMLFILGSMGVIGIEKVLIDNQLKSLHSVNEVKLHAIEKLYRDMMEQATLTSQTSAVTDGLRIMNEFKASEKIESTFNFKTDAYQQAWQTVHSRLGRFKDSFGFYDVFIIDLKGTVLFTEAKEADLGDNVQSGKLSTSGLGFVWSEVMKKQNRSMSDVSPYSPSNDDPAQFFAVPIMKENQMEGVFAVQIPTGLINNVTALKTDMGKTLETYLVGEDYKMRSDSVLNPQEFSVKNSMLNNKMINTEAVNEGAKGNDGYRVIKDYRGEEVLSSFNRLKIKDSSFTWVLITEIDYAEAVAFANTVKMYIFIIMIIAAVVVSFVALGLGRSIALPIARITELLQKSSRIVADSSEQLSGVSQTLSQSTTEQAASLEETSSSLEEISGMISQTTESTNIANIESEQVKETSQKGLDSSKELVNSMKEIMESNQSIENLVQVIAEIGNKTTIIDEIVFQTKLLSFNASVEAERAGEHGRGFAVVAQEVGNLAQLSGKAAGEISEIVRSSITRAEEIAKTNKEKVLRGGNLVKGTAKLLEEINTRCDAVLAKNKEISSASKEQETGVKQINEAIGQLDTVTQSNAHTADQASGLSHKLSEEVKTLDQSVNDLIAIVEGKVTERIMPTKAVNNIVSLPRSAPKRELKKVSGESWDTI